MVGLEQVRADFAALEAHVAGVFLWGSHAAGSATARSDVDVCIVAGPESDRVDALLQGLAAAAVPGKRYDVHVFEELPLFLKGAVLDHGVLLFARDRVGLEEYLWTWRKVWEDQKLRRGLAGARQPGAAGADA